MKKSSYIIILLFLLQFVNAQIHEIGIFAGGSNFIGDVGPTTYIHPKQPAFGILYKWNVNPRYAWRASVMQSKILARDINSDNTARKQRNYNFVNNITEFSAGLEFNWFDFNLHNADLITTPYIFSGLNYFRYDNLYVNNGQYQNAGKSGAIALPIYAGVKVKIANQFVLGAEVGARYTFIDDLDGSNSKSDNFKYLSFGNPNSNDWYVFSGLTLTYTFGNKPCYCNE